MIDRKYGVVTLERKPDVPEDEPVFVLRAQDILAPAAVRAYANLVEATVPGAEGAGMADAIRSSAEDMARWREANGGGKLPDGVRA